MTTTTTTPVTTTSLRSLADWLARSFWFVTQFASISFLPGGKRQIFVVQHVCNLLFHGGHKQRQEIDQQDGPEHRNVQKVHKRADERHNERSCGGVPKLEFG